MVNVSWPRSVRRVADVEALSPHSGSVREPAEEARDGADREAERSGVKVSAHDFRRGLLAAPLEEQRPRRAAALAVDVLRKRRRGPRVERDYAPSIFQIAIPAATESRYRRGNRTLHPQSNRKCEFALSVGGVLDRDRENFRFATANIARAREGLRHPPGLPSGAARNLRTVALSQAQRPPRNLEPRAPARRRGNPPTVRTRRGLAS